MKQPKHIYARPIGASKNWEDVTSGPWALDDPYGTATCYTPAIRVPVYFTLGIALGLMVSLAV